MRKNLSFILVLLFICSLPALVWASPTVRIGIVNGKDSVTISGQRPYKIIKTNENSVIAKGEVNDKWQIEYRDGQLYLNNQLQNAPLVFRMEPGDDNEYLIVDGRRYRGELEIRPSVTKKGLTVIELLPLEEYIYGIIPGEISPAWPMEAVKAQAVAARTYALYHIGKHQKDGFDLCVTTDCQVYGGREVEDPRGNWAVDATRGMMVTYNNKLVPTFFHSSSGGYTENIENVWNEKIDYVRAVPDFDQKSPYFQWKSAFTLDEVTKRLIASGYKIGNLQGIKLSPLASGVNESPDRGVSGRVKTITFIGSDQTVNLTGNAVRQLFKLNSTLFDIKVTEPAPEQIKTPDIKPVLLSAKTDLPVADNTKQETLPKLSKKKKRKTSTPAVIQDGDPALQSAGMVNTVPEKQGVSVAKPLPAEPVIHLIIQPAATTTVVFEGRGSGHGLGLSQWGAKAMAEQGPKDDLTYYQQILKHYYQGVEITKWY